MFYEMRNKDTFKNSKQKYWAHVEMNLFQTQLNTLNTIYRFIVSNLILIICSLTLLFSEAKGIWTTGWEFHAQFDQNTLVITKLVTALSQLNQNINFSNISFLLGFI